MRHQSNEVQLIVNICICIPNAMESTKTISTHNQHTHEHPYSKQFLSRSFKFQFTVTAARVHYYLIHICRFRFVVCCCFFPLSLCLLITQHQLSIKIINLLFVVTAVRCATDNIYWFLFVFRSQLICVIVLFCHIS